MVPERESHPKRRRDGRANAPTFLIIGAAKSGTTSLHHYLDQHPEVFMCPVKETNFFAFCDAMPRFRGPGAKFFLQTSVPDRDRYRSLFSAGRGHRARGEASPWYMVHPGTAARIHRYVPEVKLVAILRHPADRAFSAFTMRVRDGLEPCQSLREAIADQSRRDREGWAIGGYVSRGFYCRQLRPYYSLFPREQIRVYLFDELKRDPVGLLRDLFAFIGVSSDFIPDLSARLNRSGVIRNPVVRTLWTRSNPLRDLVRPLLPERVRRGAFRLLIREVEKPPPDPELHQELTELYREDILCLQELIGRDLTAWLEGVEERSGQGKPRESETGGKDARASGLG